MKFALIVLCCLLTTVFATHGTRDSETDAYFSRVCIQIGVHNVNVRTGELHFLGEIKSVKCNNGEEFCTSSETCCCQIPRTQHNNTGMFAGIGVSVAFFLLFVFCLFAGCGRRQRYPWRQNPQQPRTGADNIITVSTIRNYESKHHPPPPVIFNNRANSPDVGGATSVDSFNFGKGKTGRPLSISGSVPPPPYSEHSFGVYPSNGAMVLYKDGIGSKDADKSLYSYTKRSSRPSSVTSWMKSQDDRGAPSVYSTRSKPASVRSSIARNSQSGTSGRSASARRAVRGREMDSDLVSVPSVRSGRGSTLAASEVIYDVRGPASTVAASEAIYDARAPSMKTRSYRGSDAASTIQNADAISHAGSVVSYNPATSQ